MLVKKTIQSPRWTILEEFNCDSPVQILRYMALKNHKGGSAKKAKTNQASTDKKTLERLAKVDPFYRLILERRKITKIKSTYVMGTFQRLDKDNRIHPHFGHSPSTLRTNSYNPNLQNVVADKG